MDSLSFLLLNVFIIQFTSYSSDNWLRITYSRDSLDNCTISSHRQYALADCISIDKRLQTTHLLIEQHASLYRVCDDLTDAIRRYLTQRGLLHSDQCTFHFRIPSRFIALSLITSIASTTFALISIGLIGYSIFITRLTPRTIVVILSLSIGANVIVLLLTIVEVIRKRESIYEMEPDWSFYSSIGASVLQSVCIVAYEKRSRTTLSRQRSLNRTRQLNRALMRASTKEISLAIRAKVTVL